MVSAVMDVQNTDTRDPNDTGTRKPSPSSPTATGEIFSTEHAGQSAGGNVAERPVLSQDGIEQMEVQDSQTDEENNRYPTGKKFTIILATLCLASALTGLDLGIISTAIPSITDHFHTIADIGWYVSVARLTLCSFFFMFGKMYTVFSIKYLLIISLVIFEVGSLLCTIAWTSKVFILGRALAGMGSAGIYSGAFAVSTRCVPLRRRPLIGSILGFSEVAASVSGPLLGGILTDKLSWRACFGINLPLGALSLLAFIFVFQDPDEPNVNELSFREKIKQIDLLGTVIFVPAMTSLLLALQWGGITYGWGNARIIALLVLFFILLSGFAYLQHRLQDKATLPPRILRQRSIISGAWFSFCANAAGAVVDQYLAIYFQTVEGYSAAKSGALLIPQVVGLTISALSAGALITAIGYYAPFMLATSVIAPISAGLLTTLKVNDKLARVLAFEGLLGFAIGLGIQAPQVAAQTVLSAKEASIGIAVVIFGQNLGPTLFTSAAQTVFQRRLAVEIGRTAPGTNVTSLENLGLSEIRNQLGGQKLKDALLGYDQAITQTMYLPLALTCLTLLGSLGMEWRSVKKKQT